MSRRKRRVSMMAGLLVALLGGFPAWADQTQALRERAERYWEARRLNDLVTEYQLESGSLPEGGLTPDRFVGLVNNRNQLIRDQNARITDVTVRDDEGEVTLLVDRVFVRWGSTKKDQVVKEKWLLLEGEWYRRTGPDLQEMMRSIGSDQQSAARKKAAEQAKKAPPSLE
jgi:hypothetical protein